MIENEGFYEYFDPTNKNDKNKKRACGSNNFSWTAALYLDFYKTSNGYKFIFEDISNIADSKENFADKINEIIERSVTKAPEHYLWHHRRFKSQAPEIYD